jgi:hypothetical protein
MLKRVVFFSLLSCLVGLNAHGQALKKKYIGSFVGIIPAYRMESGEQLISIEAGSIQIALLPNNMVEEMIGTSKMEGSYKISSETKTTITVMVNYPNQLVYEELVIDKKDKKMVRKGFYPQPSCLLMKK